MQKRIDTKAVTKLILLQRWSFLNAEEDIKQCIVVSEITGTSVHTLVERLARELGWRKIKEKGKRRWVPEHVWLKMHFKENRRTVGAPYGNTNRKKKNESKKD